MRAVESEFHSLFPRISGVPACLKLWNRQDIEEICGICL